MSDQEMRATDGHCAWIPEFTSRGQVSKMFHLTNCGVTGAATIASGNWKFCPHCGRQVIFRTWREIYEGMAAK